MPKLSSNPFSDSEESDNGDADSDGDDADDERRLEDDGDLSFDEEEESIVLYTHVNTHIHTYIFESPDLIFFSSLKFSFFFPQSNYRTKQHENLYKIQLYI